MNITYNTQEENKADKVNPYFTKLQDFNFEDAGDEDWFRWTRLLGSVDFEEETKSMSTNCKLQRFYDILESTAELIFKKKEYLEKQQVEENQRARFQGE